MYDVSKLPKGFTSLGWEEFKAGFQFSVPFLAVLTVHEFGHYFTAKANRVKVSLPFYIPLWLGVLQSIGTLGAFIRINEYINSRRKYFDIGIAGPLAGFVIALIVLWYGFTHLPPVDYIFTIHPEYKKFGLRYGEFAYLNMPPESAMAFGDNLLFWFFKTYVADPALMPHPYEMVHYPILLAGYLSLFFTSLNLLPIGQLDGGHVLYALIGSKRHRLVSPVLFVMFAFYAGLGMYTADTFAVASDERFYEELLNLGFYIFFLYICFYRISENRTTTWLLALSVVVAQFAVSWAFPTVEGYSGFLAFALVLGRFLGVYHPETELQEPLDTKRKILGWLALIIFILCFSPKPFVFS
jgi:membrane-associated protease RseP (regulator of RpoE activity)